MSKDDLNKPRVIEVPPSSQVSHVIIHDNTPTTHARPANKDMTPRSMGALISGGLGAVIGYAGSALYVNGKMADFEAEVAKATKKNIMGRVGAGIAEGGLTSMGTGFGSHEIHYANAWEAIETGKHPFPKFLYKWFGGPQGAGIVKLGAAALAGASAIAIYYALVPKDKAQEVQINNAPGGDTGRGM